MVEITRRQFIGRGLGVAALAGLGSVGLAACGGESSRSSQAGGGVARTLRMHHELQWGGDESLDPAAPNRFWPTVSLLYNKLVRLDADGRIQPELAESWEPDAEARRWTIRLREGVTFHDGKPLVAEDVAYTIRHVLDPKLESPGAAVLQIVDPEAFETPDDRTVVFSLTQPHADFPILLTHYSAFVVPADSGAEIGERGIGTGPFRLDNLEPDGTTSLAAYGKHWARRPGLAGVEITAITEAQAAVDALLAGQIDYVETANSQPVRAVQGRDGFKIKEGFAGAWSTLVMRCDEPPFEDVRVRQAMRLVTDREAMIQAALQGNGLVASDSPVAPSDQYRLEANRPRDVARARDLLTEAGHGNGLDVTLHTTSERPQMVPMATAYKEAASEAGINVEIQQDPADSYWDETWLKAPFCISDWGPRPADQVLNEVFRTGADWNEGAWSNERFDGLLDDARREPDAGRRGELYRQAQRLVMDESGHIIPFHFPATRAMSAGVSGPLSGVRSWDIDWSAVSLAQDA